MEEPSVSEPLRDMLLEPLQVEEVPRMSEPVAARVVVPEIVRVPLTVRFEGRRSVEVPESVTLFQAMPAVSRVVEAATLRVELVVVTVPEM
jgi:hypothetical protein